MRRLIGLAFAISGIALVLTAIAPGLASAHEKRQVGAYTFVVGFINEPAIVDQPNSIDLTVTDSNNQPVTGVDKTLKAQITYGGETQDMALSPRFNAPGKYNAYFIPTRTGTWKFHFTGAVNDQKVDELFTSGPGRFNDVESTTTLDFPAKTPDMVTLSAQTAAAKSAADSTKSTANAALALGIAGIVVGVLGLAVGGYALLQSRRGSGSTAAAGAPLRPTT